jgi:phage/plasmid-like protein (TIGR03299 family)
MPIEPVYIGSQFWRAFGTPLPEGTRTWSDMIHVSGMDWEVAKEPSYWLNPINNLYEPVPDRYVIRRKDNNTILSTVGNLFMVLQNTSAGVPFDELTNGNLITYETAGAVKGGRIIWVLARVPKLIRVGGFDEVNLYLLITYGHDGTMAVTIHPTCIRKRNGGTHVFELSQIEGGRYKSKHTNGMGLRLEDMKGTLNKIVEWFLNTYEPQCQSLFTKMINEEQVRKFIEDLGFGGASAKSKGIADSIMRLYETGVNSNGLDHSAWAMYSAVVEFVDHERSTKKQGGSASEGEARLVSAWMGAGSQLKNEALRLLSILPNATSRPEIAF